MSFLASFATGFATQATKDIEERDKELREKADKYWEALLKEREKATLRADKRVEELTTQSKQIMTLLPDITDAELTTILHSGQSDKLLNALIEAQTKQGKTFKAKELITDVPESQISPSEYLSSVATRGVPKLEMPAMEDRLPFGLRSTAMQDARAKYLKEAGIRGEEKQETFKRPVEGGRINYAALAAPKEDKRTRMEIAKQKLQDQYLDANTDEEKAAINLAANALNEFGKLKEPGDFNKQFIDPLKIEAGKLEKQINEEKDPNKRRSLQAEFTKIDARVRVLSGVGKALKEPDAEDAFKYLGTFRSAFQGISNTANQVVQTTIGGAGFVPTVNSITGESTLIYTGTDPKAWNAIYEQRARLVTDYVNTVVKQVGRVPPSMIIAASGMGIQITPDGKVNVKRLGREAGNIPPSTPATAAPSSAPGLGARAQPKPATQAPAPAKTEPKQMPTGAKLTEYANAHFGGDVTKAKNYLSSQGYK